ncbi:hypothetical protein [Alienimonas sp. DA493]|uniref:hypothetical protein n=1 Tax=Alienimonas sp. DA493 TaxID=3373605 RepID=UPI0037551931
MANTPLFRLVRINPHEAADAEAVAAAREAVASVNLPGGIMVDDATAVDPLTLRFKANAADTDRVLAALRRAGILTERHTASGSLRKPGGRADAADLKRRADRARRSLLRLEQQKPDERRDGGPSPDIIRFFLDAPVGDRGDAARAAVAALPTKFGAALDAPSPEHRTLVVRLTERPTDFAQFRLKRDRVRIALLEAGFSIDASSNVTESGNETNGRDDEAEPDHPAESPSPKASDEDAVGEARPRLLLLTLKLLPGVVSRTGPEKAVRDALRTVDLPDVELLVADWPGRTLAIRYTGTRTDAGSILMAVQRAVLEQDREATMKGAQAAAQQLIRNRRRGGPSVLALRLENGEAAERFKELSFESSPIADPEGFQPPAEEARTVVLTFTTPVPGRPAANTAVIRRALPDAGVKLAKLAEADWEAGRVTVQFVGYPWGGDRIADAFKAAGAPVVEHATSLTNQGGAP